MAIVKKKKMKVPDQHVWTQRSHKIIVAKALAKVTQIPVMKGTGGKLSRLVNVLLSEFIQDRP